MNESLESEINLGNVFSFTKRLIYVYVDFWFLLLLEGLNSNPFSSAHVES